MPFYPFMLFDVFWLGEREVAWSNAKRSRYDHATGRAAKPGVQGRSPGRRICPTIPLG